MNSRIQINNLLSGEASASLGKLTDKGGENHENTTSTFKGVKNTTEQESKNARGQEKMESITQEDNISRTLESKNPRGQENKNSSAEEEKDKKTRRGRPRKESQMTFVSVKNNRVVESDGIRRSPANITLREDYQIALKILAAKRRVKMWMLLDEAIGAYLAAPEQKRLL